MVWILRAMFGEVLVMPGKYWTEKEREYLIRCHGAIPITVIAKNLDRPYFGVYKQARRLQLTGKRYNINSYYFHQWSNDMAYILGLLFTDGCMYQERISLGFKRSDAYILSKILNVMDSNHRIYYWKNNFAQIQIGNSIMCKRLLKLGLRPKKSLMIDCPKVPEKYIPKFLLGVIDGDGTIEKKRMKIKIFTGSKKFQLGLSRLLNIIDVHHTKWQREREGCQTQYLIHITTIEAMNKLIDLMYKDANLYLKRKWEICHERF